MKGARQKNMKNENISCYVNITRSCFENYTSRYGRNCKKFVVSELSKSLDKVTAWPKCKKSCGTCKEKETKYHLFFKPLIKYDDNRTLKRSMRKASKKTKDRPATYNLSCTNELDNFVMSNGLVSRNHNEKNEDGLREQKMHEKNEINNVKEYAHRENSRYQNALWKRKSNNHNIAWQDQGLKPFSLEGVVYPENLRRYNFIQAIDNIFSPIQTFDENNAYGIICINQSDKQKRPAPLLDLQNLKMQKSESNVCGNAVREHETLETKEVITKNHLLKRQLDEWSEVISKDLCASKKNSGKETPCKHNLKKEKLNVQHTNHLDGQISVEQMKFTRQQILQTQDLPEAHNMTCGNQLQAQVSEEIMKREFENDDARMFSETTCFKFQDVLKERFSVEISELRTVENGFQDEEGKVANNMEVEKERQEIQAAFVTDPGHYKHDQLNEVINEPDLYVCESNKPKMFGVKTDLLKELSCDRTIKCENDSQMYDLKRKTEKSEDNNHKKDMKPLISVLDEGAYLSISENNQNNTDETGDPSIFSFPDENTDSDVFSFNVPKSDSDVSVKEIKQQFFSQPLNKRKSPCVHRTVNEPVRFSTDDEFCDGETLSFKKVKYEKDYSEFGTPLANAKRSERARSSSFYSDRKTSGLTHCGYSLRSNETLKLSCQKVLRALQSLNNSIKKHKSFSGIKSDECKVNGKKNMSVSPPGNFLNERCAASYSDPNSITPTDSFLLSNRENRLVKDSTFCSESNESTPRLSRNSDSYVPTSDDAQRDVPCKTKNNVMKYIDAFKKLKRKTSQNVCGVVKRNFMKVRNADCKKYSQLASDYFDDFTHMMHQSLMKQPLLDLSSDKENQVDYHSSPRVRHVCRRKPHSYHRPESGAAINLSALPPSEKLKIEILHKDRRLLLQKYEPVIPRSVMMNDIPDFYSDFITLECFDLFNSGLSNDKQ